jgi:hypothetical protein
VEGVAVHDECVAGAAGQFDDPQVHVTNADAVDRV